MWTWVGGVNATMQSGIYGTKGGPTASNYPGSRGGAAMWFDESTGDIWLFGGTGYDSVGTLGMCH